VQIAESISPRHYQDGFHSTEPVALRLGRCLFQDSPLRIQEDPQCPGLAASHSGGLRENFGTMTKPFQAGHGAESGLASVELVALGWNAAEQILEADRGFFHAFGGSFDPSAILNHLGKPWTFSAPGVSLNPIPLAHWPTPP